MTKIQGNKCVHYDLSGAFIQKSSDFPSVPWVVLRCSACLFNMILKIKSLVKDSPEFLYCWFLIAAFSHHPLEPTLRRA